MPFFSSRILQNFLSEFLFTVGVPLLSICVKLFMSVLLWPSLLCSGFRIFSIFWISHSSRISRSVTYFLFVPWEWQLWITPAGVSILFVYPSFLWHSLERVRTCLINTCLGVKVKIFISPLCRLTSDSRPL